MQDLQPGTNILLNTATPLKVIIKWTPEKITGFDVDASAFMLLASGKVRSDNDFIFYNQPKSIDNSVQLSGSMGNQIFTILIPNLSRHVERIIFALTIHGNTNFASCNTLSLSIGEQLRFSPDTGGMKEKALVLGELYLRNKKWKFRAIGQGFYGGLEPLAKNYGVNIEEAESQSHIKAERKVDTNTPHTINLQKRIIDLEKTDPKMVSLVKKVRVSLEKKGLSEHQAKVALCLDISASMSKLFRNGSIDQLVQRILALGFNFDDNGNIDIFLFGANAHEYGGLNTSNYQSFVQDMLRRYPLEGGTSYGKAIYNIRSFYRKQQDNIPVYVMFVTDGNTSDSSLTETQIKEASHEGIFWQFMAIGKHPNKKAGFFSRIFQSDFSFLEKLDTMPGRFVDNANFFLVESPSELSDEQLYDLLMQEYPDWLKLARAKRLIV